MFGDIKRTLARPFWRLFLFALLAALPVFTLAGCGSDDDSGSNPGQAQGADDDDDNDSGDDDVADDDSSPDDDAADDDSADDDDSSPVLPGPPVSAVCPDLPDAKMPQPRADNAAERKAAALLSPFVEDLRREMGRPETAYADKLRAMKKIVTERGPALRRSLRALTAKADGNGLPAGVGAVADYLLATIDWRLRTAYLPAARVVTRPAGKDEYVMTIVEATMDRYWRFYHWTEILGGYYDDSDYRDVFAWADRESIIAEEIGEAGIQMLPDYWRVLETDWTDPDKTENQRLMWAKFTMFDDPDWSNQEWVPDYWKLQPAWKDEDLPLFTGNLLASLAFEYPYTREPRTLSQMQAIYRAYQLFDRYRLDGDHPLDQEAADGRIQRGPTTKNFYPEDEAVMFDITSWWPFEYNYSGSFEDHLTGRERKNVSRDQYYGTILGYYGVFKNLGALADRTAEETALYCEVVAHMSLMLDYLFTGRLKPEYGLDYNLYALFEGALANPPNLTFMNFWAYPGYEEMTGHDFSALFGLGNKLIKALLDLGAALGGVELSQALFDPAQSGLTGLNQYMVSLYLSNLTPEQWQFIYPAEVLVEHPERETMWRRVIALFFNKYGQFGNDVYQADIEAMLAEEIEPPTLDQIAWHYENGLVYVEPQCKVEDLRLPLMAMTAAAANRAELGAALEARYQELLADGVVDFTATDLPYAR